MKLYLIRQSKNNGYDTYDSAVVTALDEDSARNTSPDNMRIRKDNTWYYVYPDGTEEEEKCFDSWVDDINDVEVIYLGEAKEGTAAGVICTSFNAG